MAINVRDTRIAVMGAGAVGSYFGGMFARGGARVTLIGRPAHVDAIRASKLFLDTVTFQERIAIDASNEVSAVRDAQCGSVNLLVNSSCQVRSRNRAVP